MTPLHSSRIPVQTLGIVGVRVWSMVTVSRTQVILFLLDGHVASTFTPYPRYGQKSPFSMSLWAWRAKTRLCR